ncbi:phage tail tape measure protein [Streptomyces aurantiacus]|uniref:phage tail tape measure protein n=1 Tax=Streptomyces aurantiacus TaxID=47760 RepID=UPI003326E5FD
MPVEIGVGYVSVVPEARGFGRRFERQLAGELAGAGLAAGRESGKGFLGGIGDVVKTGVAGFAAGAGALFAAGFVEAVEQDKSNAKLAAQLGLSEKESARIGAVAGKVYASGYGESVDQVNQSLKALAQNGVAAVNAPKKDLAGLSKSALALAETFEVDVSDSARAAGQLIKTGMVKDARGAFDLITRGFQTGADKAGDMLDTLNEYSTQFRDLGLTGSQAVGLLTQGLKAGARDSDIVADALKEFAIRAKDGSDTTKQGFDAIGLSADQMAQTFAKGGPGAAKALDTVLDRLRDIKDPAKRSQVAVKLFGTQAEDLQQSLYSLDPSRAEAALGKVDGAAGRMGKTLHNNATQPLEVFKRQVLQGLATVADKYALPALVAFGTGLNRYVLPPSRAVGGALVDVLVPAVTATGGALAAGGRWVRDYGVWLLPLVVAVGGLAVTMGASAIATAATTVAFSAYRAVILTTAAVTRGYTIAQAALNAVMSANPVGLIITGVAALAALLIVAYTRSETFRNIVQTGFRAVGAAAVWLWQSVLSPTFSAIGTAGKVLFTILAVVVVAPLVIAFRTFGLVIGWLWNTAIGPAFRAIGALGRWLYNTALRPAAAGSVAAFRAMGAAGSWLYRSAIAPAARGIGSVLSWLLGSSVKPVAAGVKTAFRTMGAAGTALYRSAIKPAFDGIGSAASFLWTKGLKPAFDAGKRGVGLFAGAFKTAKDGIAKQWGEVDDVAKRPVNFVIDMVYTHGIKAVWDKVAGFVGLGKLPKAPKLLAAGGAVGPWGPAAPMKVSKPTAIVGEGRRQYPEFVIPTDPRYRGRARSLWEAAGTQLMADGGVLGTIKGWGGDAVDWGVGKAKKIGGAVMDGLDLLTDPGKMWDKAIKPVRDKIAKVGQSRWAQAIGKLPVKMIGGLKDKVVSKAKSLFGSGGGGDIGGSGVKRWSSVVLQALKLVGQPASLLGITLRRMNQESAGNPRAINNSDINAKNGTPSKGLMQVIGPTFAAYAGKLRGRGIWDPLANIYASMRYALSRYGSLASAYNRPGGYARGGSPRPGELAWVGEAGPELVRFKGGETVYDHRTSLGMAAGLGAVRGFAKGTRLTGTYRSPTEIKARRELPGDLKGFTKSLTGSASDIARAAKSLADDLRKTGKAGRGLADKVGRTSAKLQGLARRRETVASTLATARQAAVDQRQSAKDYLGLTNINGGKIATVGDLISGMKTRQSSLSKFQGLIKTAQKKGVDQSVIQQMVAAGPDSGLAQLISGASAGDIKKINSLAKSGAKLSTSYGNTMADAMYDSGKRAGDGFLAGLRAQEKALQKQMDKLGDALVDSIRKRLKIRSPSRETEEVGEMVGAGVVVGTDKSLAAVRAGAKRLGRAAIPPVVPTAEAVRAAAQAGGQPGGTTYNVYPRTLDMSVRDLELLQRRQDALARVGRPR